MSDGFYKRRRGALEHIEAGTIDLLDDGIHDYLSMKANLVIGNGYKLPAGVVMTSAVALRRRCRCVSERTIQRRLNHMEEIGWLKFSPWRIPGKRGNYVVLICRASVHDLSGNEYRVNGEKTTDWRNPVYEAVGEATESRRGGFGEVSGNREVKKTEERTEKNPAAKPRPPGDPRHQPFTNFASAEFEQRRGQKPTWGGRDFKALSVALASNKTLDIDELKRRFRNFLDSTEPFTQKQGGSLAYFCTHVDSFLGGPILATPQKGGSNGKSAKPGFDPVATAAALGFNREQRPS